MFRRLLKGSKQHLKCIARAIEWRRSLIRRNTNINVAEPQVIKTGTQWRGLIKHISTRIMWHLHSMHKCYFATKFKIMVSVLLNSKNHCNSWSLDPLFKMLASWCRIHYDMEKGVATQSQVVTVANSNCGKSMQFLNHLSNLYQHRWWVV